MKIVVHDTASAMFDLLHSPSEERPDALRDMLGPLQSGALPEARSAETVHVVLVLGDPDDDHLTVRSADYFGMGGIPGRSS